MRSKLKIILVIALFMLITFPVTIKPFFWVAILPIRILEFISDHCIVSITSLDEHTAQMITAWFGLLFFLWLALRGIRSFLEWFRHRFLLTGK